MPDLIRINLSTLEITHESIESDHPLELYAGRALSSKVIADEVPPLCDPLSPENKLIFATGFLGGTLAPNSGRISIGSKSPLTGGVKESNVGGRAPALLAQQNIRGVILEGAAQDWAIIKVANGEVEIINAAPYLGLNNYALAQKLQADFGSRIGAFTIGTAGERLFRFASVASIDLEGYPSRHAGRGGMGTIMGSKKVKALILEPPKSNHINYHDFEGFKEIVKPWAKNLYETRRAFSKFGTCMGLMTVNEHHGLPTQNFRRGQFTDADKISGEALNAFIVKNNGKFGIGCSPGCVIRCSNLLLDSNGKHLTSSLEYETVALNGSNLLIHDLAAIAKIDQLSDDIGLDSIEGGNTLAVLMEAGILKWGDGSGVINYLEGLGEGEPDKEDFGLGARELGKKLGVKRVAQVKGQGFPGYDPRSFKGMGATYVTSPMGADHTAGPAIVGRKAYANKEYGQLQHPHEKVSLSKELQLFIYLLDSMGMCYFVGPSWETIEILSKLLKFRYGWSYNREDWMKWALNGLKMEKDFNVQAGLPETEDMPEFITNEPLEEIDRRWDIDLDEIASFWDQTD
jgi:aldehyde:ferredoxin oxidoreductase